MISSWHKALVLARNVPAGWGQGWCYLGRVRSLGLTPVQSLVGAGPSRARRDSFWHDMIHGTWWCFRCRFRHFLSACLGVIASGGSLKQLVRFRLQKFNQWYSNRPSWCDEKQHASGSAAMYGCSRQSWRCVQIGGSGYRQHCYAQSVKSEDTASRSLGNTALLQ